VSSSCTGGGTLAEGVDSGEIVAKVAEVCTIAPRRPVPCRTLFAYEEG